MDQMTIAIIGLLVGALLGYIAGEVLPSDTAATKATTKVARKVIGAFLGALLGHLAVTSITSQLLVGNVERLLQRSTPYDKAESAIATLEEPSKTLFRCVLDESNARLSVMSQGEILIARDDVFNVWRRTFELMKNGDKVYATNLVSQSDWKFFGPEGGGRQTQEDAIARGVTVRRIMLADSMDKEHTNGLHELTILHKQVGVDVREIPVNWLETPAFQGWLQQLGTSDIVIFGDSLLLLTYVHPDNKSISRSVITTNKEKLAAARAFYDRIWKDARPPSNHPKAK